MGECSDCGDTGWVGAESGAERCQCIVGGLARARRVRARVPARYHGKSLRSFEPVNGSTEEAHFACRNFVECWPDSLYMGKQGLMLIGAPGVGKTHLAVAALYGIIDKGADGQFVSALRLFRRLQSSYQGGGEENEWSILKPLLRADLLVLDDVGARRVTEWSHDVLTELVSERYDEEKATILTTNYTGEELAARIGVRLMSRLAEVCTRVAINAPDYRLQP